MEPQYPCTLTIHRFVGDKAFTHHETKFDAHVSKEDMLKTLDAVRSGLPFNFGASLTDERGYNVR